MRRLERKASGKLRIRQRATGKEKNMTAKEFYETIGQNYEEVLERLAGSEALVLKFLKKFSTDKTYAALEEAMAAGD